MRHFGGAHFPNKMSQPCGEALVPAFSCSEGRWRRVIDILWVVAKNAIPKELEPGLSRDFTEDELERIYGRIHKTLAPPSDAGSAASSLWTELPTWTDAPPDGAANPRGRFFAQLDRFEDFQRGRPDLAAGVPVQAPRRPWRPSSPRPNGSARLPHRDGAGKREGFLRC